jgi:molybdopterin-binding protein
MHLGFTVAGRASFFRGVAGMEVRGAEHADREMEKQGMLTRSEAAAALGVTPKTLYMWERDGKIKHAERDWRGWRWYAPADIAEIRAELRGVRRAAEPMLPMALDLSAKNRLAGMVLTISGDSVVSEVVLMLEGGEEVAAVIPRSEVERLGLKVGDQAVAFINAMDVMIGR